MQFLYWLESIRIPVLDGFFSLITKLGDETMFIVAAIVVFWCFSKKLGYYLMAAGVSGTVVNQTLKITCQVPRPWVKDPSFTIVESAREAATGYSFPSGHTQNGVVVWGGIARMAKKTWLRVLGIVLAALIGLSRMYLGVHTPADVGVAAVCGLALVLGLYPIFNKSDEKPQYITCTFAVIAALALAAALYVELRVWPEDIDQNNLASAIKNCYTMLGCALGALIAAPVERKYVRFETKAPWWAQILKVAVGFGLMMALKGGLKSPLMALCGGHGIAHTLRYGIMVFLAIAVWPMTFPWFSRGCPLGRRWKKALKILGIAVLCLVLLLAAFFWVVTKDTPRVEPVATDNAENPLITSLGETMLSGHRAGGGIAPENTMAALINCVESDAYELDIFEFDLHLTADGALVLLHDSTLDRTSDAAEVFGYAEVDVGTKTLAELKTLNMGAKFEAADGSKPYAGLNTDDVPDELRIITLEEALKYLEACGEYRYIIEIKNGGAEGFAAADRLYETLTAFGCLDRTVVGTFHNEVTAYMDETYPDMPRSAGVMECVEFYFSALLNLKRDADAFPFQALQIPTTDYVINLGTSRVVNYAHAYNIAVQYWTINDAGEMARLQAIGADAVMTDVPDVGAQMLNQPEKTAPDETESLGVNTADIFAEDTAEVQLPDEEPLSGQSGTVSEIPGSGPDLPEARADFADIFESAGIQPEYQLAPEDGLGYEVFARGSAENGISQYEFVYDGDDRVIAMAETHYAFYSGVSQEDIENEARLMETISTPSEETENVTVSCQVVGECTVLKILVEGLDDPAVVRQLAELAVIPETEGDYLSFGRTGDSLGIAGYVAR